MKPRPQHTQINRKGGEDKNSAVNATAQVALGASIELLRERKKTALQWIRLEEELRPGQSSRRCRKTSNQHWPDLTGNLRQNLQFSPLVNRLSVSSER